MLLSSLEWLDDSTIVFLDMGMGLISVYICIIIWLDLGGAWLGHRVGASTGLIDLSDKHRIIDNYT